MNRMKGKDDDQASAGAIGAGPSMRGRQANVGSRVPEGRCGKTAAKTSPTGFGRATAFEEGAG
jgi:hypothetical protein